MIETMTVCGSCATGEHMCGGNCQCGCMAYSDEEIAEMHWLYLKGEYGDNYGDEEEKV